MKTKKAMKKAKKAEKIKAKKSSARFLICNTLGNMHNAFICTDDEGIPYHFDLDTGKAKLVTFV